VLEGYIPENVDTPNDLREQHRRNATGIWKYQEKVYHFYHADWIQIFVAILIFLNFFMECVRRQIDPDPDQTTYQDLWDVLEYFFTIAFLIELIINAYGSWWRTFFKSSWNYFDMFVVGVGIVLLFAKDLPGPLNFVKMCRAFRVFRLFGRIPSLKKILGSIEKALPGVLHAFIIMLLVVCIYAVLAVDLYADYYDLDVPNEPRPPVTMTARDRRYGDEYYGNFGKSLYTLFQVLTGESWSEMGVRPILHWDQEQKDTFDNIISAFFFTSFVLINGVILLNVVVAVLLDGMTAAAEEQKQASEDEEEDKATNGNTDDDKESLKEEVSAVKAQVAEMRLKLREALALVSRDVDLREESLEVAGKRLVGSSPSRR